LVDFRQDYRFCNDRGSRYPVKCLQTGETALANRGRKSALSLGCIWLIAALANSGVCCAADWSPDVFDQKIAPILAEHCLSCHSGAEPKGKLNLSNHDAAKRGGESGNALTGITAHDNLIAKRVAEGEMPPEKTLPASDRDLLTDWIRNGAVWGTSPIDAFRHSTNSRAGYDWWSLQPIQRPEVPHVQGVSNSIDAFVQLRLQQAGLDTSPLASPRMIIRRLSYDLLGLPPTPIEVKDFESVMQVDPTAAVSQLVDRLLLSKHFGERWARHWLDVVRFGESQGFERDKLRDNSWYYRDWVINAINNEMPYDQFAQQQIAGDVLQPNDANAVIATGFLVAGPWDEVGQSQQSVAMKAVVRQDEMEDYVGTISQAFIGLTTNCARCHDHKFDPIRQKEYYRMSAALAGVRHGSRDVKPVGNEQASPFSVYAATPRQPDATYLLARGNAAQKLEAVTAGGIAAVTGVVADFQVDANASDADRRRQLANWITDRQNPLFVRVIVNRLWHYHFGAGLVETPNDFGFNGGLPSHPDLLDYLAAELIESGFRLKHIHRLIVTSQTYLQASRHRTDCAAVDAGNRLLWRKSPSRLDAETLRDAILSVTGQLNPQLGGPPYRDFTTHTHNSQFYDMVDVDSPDVYRRTIYRTWIRSGRNHLLDVFDCPDPSTTAPKRSMTTTPLQALTLMNNSFVLRMADRFAERVTKDVGSRADAQVTAVYALAYQRQPAAVEVSAAIEFIAEHGLAAYCRIILNSNEFIHVD
jgi:hypothetical protein